jgi:hypothetical protein
MDFGRTNIQPHFLGEAIDGRSNTGPKFLTLTVGKLCPFASPKPEIVDPVFHLSDV